LRIQPLGDAALLVQLGSRIDVRLSAKARTLANRLRTRAGVQDALASYCSVTVHYDPDLISYQSLRLAVERSAQKPSRSTSSSTGSEPWAPVPTTRRRHFQGMGSANERGVWPKALRYGFDSFFLRLLTRPRPEPDTATFSSWSQFLQDEAWQPDPRCVCRRDHRRSDGHHWVVGGQKSDQALQIDFCPPTGRITRAGHGGS
jgi:hypothetical protein